MSLNHPLAQSATILCNSVDILVSSCNSMAPHTVQVSFLLSNTILDWYTNFNIQFFQNHSVSTRHSTHSSSYWIERRCVFLYSSMYWWEWECGCWL